MKSRIIFFLIVFSIDVTAFAITPTYLNFDLEDGFAKNEFFIINTNPYPTDFTIFSYQNFKFYPYNTTIGSNNKTKIKVVLKDPLNDNGTIYVKESKEDGEDISLETIIGIKTNVTNGKAHGVKQEEVEGKKEVYEVIFTDLSVNDPNLNDVLRIDALVEIINDPVPVYSTSEIYLNHNLIDTIKSDQQYIETSGVITSYYKIKKPGEYVIATKINYEGRETDAKSKSIYIKNPWFNPERIVFVSVLVIFLLTLMFIFINKFIFDHKINKI